MEGGRTRVSFSCLSEITSPDHCVLFLERLFYAIIVVASIVMLFFFLDTLYFVFGMVILLLKI